MNPTKSTGNVFKDLGYGDGEAQNLRVRAELMRRLRRFISENDLTQTRAADLFGVSQPRVSDLVNGKIDKFSIDMLINMLSKVGLNVEVSVSDRAVDGV